MITSPLTVTVSSDGQVCLLAITGELDFTNAARAALCAASVLEDGPERLVFDLGGLDFLDCAGARVLVMAAEAVPPGCPVSVHSISSFAARVLEMLDVDLEDAPGTGGPGIPPGPELWPHPESLAGPEALADSGPWPLSGDIEPLEPPGPIRPARVIDLDQARTRHRMIRAARNIAVTEERIAVTCARLAAQRPAQADQFTAVSRSARDYASRTRKWAREHQALASAGPRP